MNNCKPSSSAPTSLNDLWHYLFCKTFLFSGAKWLTLHSSFVKNLSISKKQMKLPSTIVCDPFVSFKCPTDTILYNLNMANRGYNEETR